MPPSGWRLLRHRSDTNQGCRLFNILRRYPFDREEKADRQLTANGPYFPADNDEQPPRTGAGGRPDATRAQ